MQQNTLVSRIILGSIFEIERFNLFCNLIAFYNSIKGSVFVLFSFILLLLFFVYILMILMLFANYSYHLIEKKPSKCARYIIFGDIYVQYTNIKGSNHKKLIVVINCRTGYKFEYYKKNTRFKQVN